MDKIKVNKINFEAFHFLINLYAILYIYFKVEETTKVEKLKVYQDELKHIETEFKIKYENKTKQINEIITIESKYVALCRVNQELTKKILDQEAKRQNEVAALTQENNLAQMKIVQLMRELENIAEKGKRK